MRFTSSLILISLLSCGAADAAAGDAREACARTPLDDHVEKGRDLLIGELHGTSESPALVRCLVLTALKRGGEPLVVSLEHTPGAHDLAGEAWKSKDGRSSLAMWDLASFLFEQEKLGRLKVAFHVPVIQATRPEDIPDSAGYEKLMAAPLRELAQKNLLIALVGNLHSRRSRPVWLPYDPAGVHVGDAMLHVALEAVGPGTAWNQIGGEYKSRPMGAGIFAGKTPGTLIDGAPVEHDFAYLVPRYTASGPKHP